MGFNMAKRSQEFKNRAEAQNAFFLQFCIFHFNFNKRNKNSRGKLPGSYKKVYSVTGCDYTINHTQLAKSLRSNTEGGVFVESACNMRCHIVKNTLFHIVFLQFCRLGNNCLANTNIFAFNVHTTSIQRRSNVM